MNFYARDLSRAKRDVKGEGRTDCASSEKEEKALWIVRAFMALLLFLTFYIIPTLTSKHSTTNP